MVSTASIVTLNEVARSVCQALLEKNNEGVTPNAVNSVYKCIGKFTSFMFKKTHYDQVIAEIANFGTIVRNTASNSHSEFYLGSQLASELHQTAKSFKQAENSVKQELGLAKISAIAQVSESQAGAIL